ncbi:ABC transporter substrate-binding protein [Mycobacterium sp. AT1]|uniref:ABC transporter substrate-binding protein n=1 Tax=Mycobacterium sp. AT1 TaxID=1961706 RepID=UPI001153F408|nr:ABC transporter substrate-binding protein [Mycobacterium sp. AT1]
MDLNRRELLRRGGLTGLALVGGAAVLSACGGGGGTGPSNFATTVAPPSGPPKRGGTMIHGTAGGSTADSLTAYNINSGADFSRWRAQYETLWAPNENYEIKPFLLESYDVNPGLDVWTLRLKKGIEFSDGRTATMHDMLFSIQQLMSPEVGSALGIVSAGIDLANTTVLDDLTLRVKLKSGLVNFPEIMCFAALVPRGYDPEKPIGTGPYKISEFTPGSLTQFVRHPNYWQNGKPYCDELHIVEFQDESSRVNALLDGQILAADSMEFALLDLVRGKPGVNVLQQKTNSWIPLQMRCDKPPFDDVRVRQAFRLLIDRPAMNEGAFQGHAVLAKDLYSQNDPIFAAALPDRVRDLDKAKFLLKQAGAENLQVTLTTGDLGTGVLSMSQLFAAQAKQAGVDVVIDKLDSASFYGPNYGTYLFSPNVSAPADYLRTVQSFDGPDSQQNFTFFHDDAFSSLYFQAVKEQDFGKRKELAFAMQQIQYDTGGLIITGFYDAFDGYSTKLNGLVPNVSGLGIYNYADLWLS